MSVIVLDSGGVTRLTERTLESLALLKKLRKLETLLIVPSVVLGGGAKLPSPWWGSVEGFCQLLDRSLGYEPVVGVASQFVTTGRGSMPRAVLNVL